ncbi:MAG TPA: N-acetyl-gamma-glutamyl-phosphate reductase [Bacteroidales bacterium]|nr:N-acetyl-gamma-glutamyl-phosphate reductase [Bacteroidales bacterium]
MRKISVGIIGATGYTGSELVRILINHPGVTITLITSESRQGELFSDVHPFFKGIADHKLESLDNIENYNLDLVFLALPHGISMNFVKRFHDSKFKIIDLSGDFRLDSAETYFEWYQKEHVYPQGIDAAVYGLPEINAGKIRAAELVANPGCFPTSAILGTAPLLSGKLADPGLVIIDSKSGVTGAGVKAKTVTHFSNVNDNFKAYGLKRHRHTIEIQETLEKLTDGKTIIQFTPHLLPVDRGILSTIYLRPLVEVSETVLRETYHSFYKKAPFVRLRENVPAIKDVRGTNYCDICVNYDERTGMIIVISVIDNLVKGAAGQAVQNMNLMTGFNETEGLNQVPVNP